MRDKFLKKKVLVFILVLMEYSLTKYTMGNFERNLPS